MKLKPIKSKVLVQLVKEENKFGIILPEMDKKGKRTEKGVIVEVGNEVSEPIKSARTVLFDHFAGTPVTLGENDYLMMKSEDIQAIID